MTEIEKALNELTATVHGRVDDLEAKINRGELAGGGPQPGGVDPDAARAFYAAVRRRPVAPGEVDHDALKEYDAAFREYVRFGVDAMPTDLRNAMQVGSDPEGGYFAPARMSTDIYQRLFDTSPMRRIADQMTLLGAPSIKFPTDTNEAVTGGWVGETASRPETDTPEVGQQELVLREQFAMPKITQKLLDMADAGFDVAGWLNNKIAAKLMRDENTAFVSGAGGDRPRGFLSYRADAVTTDDDSRPWGTLQYLATGQSGGFPTVSGSTSADPDVLHDVVSKLKPGYRENAVWTMNRSTRAFIAKLKDSDGRYLVQPNIVQGQPALLLGFPIVEFEDMPSIGADSFSVAFGDFRSGYLIVDGPGIRVLRDPFTSKPYVKFYTTKWTTGDVRDYDAIKLVKFAAS